MPTTFVRSPVHVRAGPEACYGVNGDTCSESPGGVQFGRGPGNSLVVRHGPPTTLVHDRAPHPK